MDIIVSLTDEELSGLMYERVKRGVDGQLITYKPEDVIYDILKPIITNGNIKLSVLNKDSIYNAYTEAKSKDPDSVKAIDNILDAKVNPPPVVEFPSATTIIEGL
jgi:hypothetical protein